MNKYKVLAKRLVFTLAGSQEYNLNNGDVIELPKNNSYVQSLEAQQKIEKIETPVKSKNKK